MDKVKSIICSMDQMSDHWRESIKSNDDSQIRDVEVFRKKVIELLDEIKRIIKEGDQEKQEEIRKLLDDSVISDSFFMSIEKTLTHFRAMSCIRELEKRDIQLAKELFQKIMSDYVVRWDWKLQESFSEYHLKTAEDMKKVMQSLDALSDYYVKNTWVISRTVEDFREETELSEELCQFYGKLLDENYRELKLNLIMKCQEDIREELDRLKQKNDLT